MHTEHMRFPHPTLRGSRSADLALGSLIMVAIRVIVAIAIALLAPLFTTMGPWGQYIGHSMTSVFNQWDSGWYLAIAKHGYTSASSHAFYPVYPLIVRAVSVVTGFAGATITVSWLATVFVFWGICDVAERYASVASSWFTAMLLLWSPASIFLIAGYSSALLAALMIWSLRFALDARWAPAVVLAALASGVSPEGILSGVAIAITVIIGDRSWLALRRAVEFMTLGEIGIIAYAGWCWVTTGRPFIFISAERSGWTQHLALPFYATWEQLVRLFDVKWNEYVRVVMAMNAFAGVAGAVVIIWGLVLVRTNRSIVVVTLVAALGVLLSVASIDASLDGTARYVLLFAPLYVVIAVLLDQIPNRMRLAVSSVTLLGSALVSVLFAVMFTRGWWIT